MKNLFRVKRKCVWPKRCHIFISAEHAYSEGLNKALGKKEHPRGVTEK